MTNRLLRHALKLTSRAQAQRLRIRAIHTRVNSLRPSRRRRLMIFRPFAVFIRSRNPWTDLRQRLLG